MDETIFFLLNQLNGKYDVLDSLLDFSKAKVVKSVPFVLVFWALWFLPKTDDARTTIRNKLTAALLVTIPIISATRAFAIYLPYSARPIHTEGLGVNLREDQSAGLLDGWNSMPSDHASLFTGLAISIFLINRKFGLFLIFWAVVVVLFPRIIGGLHWPSDIVVGALIGGGIAGALLGPLSNLVRQTGIVRYFEAREAVGYPLLFLATFEVANMFSASRYLTVAIWE